VSVGNTALNQTGKVMECIGLMMLTYLTLSWTVSAVMNLLGRQSRLAASA
jgi:general L-amino acid transport system permease protein